MILLYQNLGDNKVFQKANALYIVVLSLKVVFMYANTCRTKPNEMLLSVVSHPDQHCLSINQFNSLSLSIVFANSLEPDQAPICRACSESKLIDTLMVFLEFLFYF